MLLCSKNKLISSASIIGASIFEELGRSFTCNKDNDGPGIDLWGALHLISCFTVSAYSVNAKPSKICEINTIRF